MSHTMRLLLRTLTAFLLGLAITAAMLFLPAGTGHYLGEWLFMALLFIPILIMGVVLLSSWWALLVMSPCVLLLAARIKNEEQVLRQGLPGYIAYTQRVRYRMIPFFW